MQRQSPPVAVLVWLGLALIGSGCAGSKLIKAGERAERAERARSCQGVRLRNPPMLQNKAAKV